MIVYTFMQNINFYFNLNFYHLKHINTQIRNQHFSSKQKNDNEPCP